MREQPNLLIIHTDQQSAWTLGAYGGTLIETPHIDTLARDGALCSNFFVNSAVCTPSRGSMLTGRYPHCHGAYRNPVHINRDEQTLAHMLAAQGYDTSYMGKWHLDGETRPRDEWVPVERSMGFTDSRYMLNRGHFKYVVENPDGTARVSYAEEGQGRYMTDWLADKAIDFVGQSRSAPFFLMVSIPDPHEPYSVREPYASMFNPKEMPIPRSFFEGDHPTWVRENPVGAGATWDDPSREVDLRKNKAAYCGEVKCIDDNVGRLLAALEEKGLEKNTIVIFTTDHGDYMGEHGLYGKNMLFESAYRIPLLVRWPGRITPGTRADRFITMVDFQQTVLGLMDLPASGREQGRDASFFFSGEEKAWTDEAFIHHSRFGYTGIFTPDYELGLARCGEHVLFDRQHDAEQLHNLINSAEHQHIIANLVDRVIRHNEELDSPIMEWLKDWQSTDREQPGDLDATVAAVEWYNARPESCYRLKTAPHRR